MTSSKANIKATKEDGIFLLAITVFVLLFLWAFPQHLYYLEEVDSIRQILTLSNGAPNEWIDAISRQSLSSPQLKPPNGSSFLLLPFYTTLGLKGLYIGNICFVLVTLYFLYLTCKKIDPARKHIAIYALTCIPVLIYTRAVSSEIPSLLFVSVACYFYFKKNKNTLELFLFGLTVGLSVWMRETTLFLFIFPILILIKEKVQHLSFVIIGFAIGIVPRFVSAYIFNQPDFEFMPIFKSYTIDNISTNVSLLGISLIFMFPLILFPLLQFQTKNQRLVNMSVLAYLVIHLLFGNYSEQSSGTERIIQASINIIPALPFLIISLCLVQKSWMPRLTPLIPWTAIALSCLVMMGLSANDKPISELKMELMSLIKSKSILLINPEEKAIIKLLTPIQAESPIKLADFNILESEKNKLDADQSYYLLTYSSENNSEKTKQQYESDSKIAEYLSVDEMVNKFEISTGQGEYNLWRLVIGE